MANGAAAHLPPLQQPTAAPTPLERRIGAVTAKAACQLGQALLEHQAGHLSDATRTACSDLIAELFDLQETTIGKHDFNAAVRIEGMAVLWEIYGDYFRRFEADPMRLDVELHKLIGHVVDLVGRVTQRERAHEALSDYEATPLFADFTF